MSKKYNKNYFNIFFKKKNTLIMHHDSCHEFTIYCFKKIVEFELWLYKYNLFFCFTTYKDYNSFFQKKSLMHD